MGSVSAGGCEGGRRDGRLRALAGVRARHGEGAARLRSASPGHGHLGFGRV